MWRTERPAAAALLWGCLAADFEQSSPRRGLDLGVAVPPVRVLHVTAWLPTNGPMPDLNAIHREVARIPGSEHCICGVRRCSDHAVRLRQCDAKGGKLPPPFTSLPAARSRNRQDSQTIKWRLCRCCFRRSQSPDDFFDIDG